MFGLPVPVFWEQSYGAHLAANRALIWRVNWIAQLCQMAPSVRILRALPVSPRAAIAAGRLLAQIDIPRKKRQGTPQQQATAWERDILIACTAWDHGYDMVSDDRDYEEIVSAVPGCEVRTPESLGFP